ncbi:MAG TPA: PCP reductase family protein [Candidatus Wujingus californicus]
MQTERIPSFIRDVVRARIEDFARKNGYREITTKIVDEARNNLMANDSLHKIITK